MAQDHQTHRSQARIIAMIEPSPGLSPLILLLGIGIFMVLQGLAAADPADRQGRGAVRARAVSQIDDLQEQLRSAGSATAVLDRWCVSHGYAAAGAVVADKLATRLRPSRQVRRQLRVGPSEPIGYRHVRLRCGSHMLSEASNWYVPSRLTPAINERLANSDVAFGRAAAPLDYRRRPLAERRLWPAAGDRGTAPIPADLFTHDALLVLPDGRPIAYVREVYKKTILDLDDPAPASGEP